MPALALNLAGDPPWDSLPLPDPEPNSDELEELKRLSLDQCSDAKLSPEEEEPDCERCGEGDLAHLRLDGECTAEEELEGRPPKWECFGISRDLCGCCGGGCADGPVLAVAAAPPPVLQDDSLLQNILSLPAAGRKR